MEKTKMLFFVIIGILLQSALSACAGAGNMQGDQMREATMQDTKMSGDKMKMDQMKSQPMPDKKMADTMTAMLTGSKGHHATGNVAFSHDMGKDLLVLSDIKIDKVPDGHVYLAKNGNRKQGIDLGILKQFSGNVSFTVPPGTNIGAYDTLIIYCEKFDVEIGRAELGKKM